MLWRKQPSRHAFDSQLLEIGPLLDGYVAGSLTLLRVGASVELTMRGLVLSKSGILWTIPAGFRPPVDRIWSQRDDFAASGPRIGVGRLGALNFISTPTGVPLYASYVCLTRQDPPFTGPGEVIG